MYNIAVILAFFFVSFTDKGGCDQVALSQEALELRSQRGIAIDSLDYAVCPKYLAALQDAGARICHTSRWMNGATVEASPEIAQSIQELPFVKAVELTRSEAKGAAGLRKRAQERFEEDEVYSRTQLEFYNLPRLHAAGYRGQGITIGVLDGAFLNLNTLTLLDSARNNGQLLGSYSYAEPEPEDGDYHGMRCLCLIAGNRPDYLGAAVKSKFYVIHTEEAATEYPKEADNWIAGIERCDSMGVWIASSSLGYSRFDVPEMDYTRDQLDGKTYRASRAATIAARKGMLVCLAGGNSLATDFPWINVPSDADSILTVGALKADSTLTDFSSMGYSADGRVKPDVCALGHHCCVATVSDETLGHGNGTSYATPLLAGLAACLWSAYPTESNMQIRERIIRSADNYNTPDHYIGYGIPDAWKAYTGGTDISETTEIRTVAEKILRDGRLIIVRDGEEYDILGHKQ